MPSFRLKRGNTSKVGAYVGNEGELIYNTETKKVHVMDGATSGGTVVEGGGAELVDSQGSAEGVAVGRATTDWDTMSPKIEPLVSSKQYASNSTHLFVANSQNDEVYAIPLTALSNHPDSTDLVGDLYTNDRTWTVAANSLYLDAFADNNGSPYGFPTNVAANDSIVVVAGEFAMSDLSGKAFILNAQTGATIAELVPPAHSGGFGYQVAITSSYIYVMQKYIDYADEFNNQVNIFVFSHSGGFLSKVEPAALGLSSKFINQFVVNDDVIAVWNTMIEAANVWPVAQQGNAAYSPLEVTRSYSGANSDPSSLRINLFSNNVLVFGDKGNTNQNAGYLQFNQIESADNPFDSYTVTATISHPAPITNAQHNFGPYSNIQKLSNGEEFLLVAENGAGHVNNTMGAFPFGMQFVWAIKSDSSLLASAFNLSQPTLFKEHTYEYAFAWMEPIPAGDKTLLITAAPENNFAVMDFTFGAGAKQLKSGADLITIPTKVSELTNDSSFATSADIPTALSQMSNDAGFVTSAAIPPSIVEIPSEAVKVDSKWAKEGVLEDFFGSVSLGYGSQIDSSSLNMLDSPPRHDWTVSATHSNTHTNYGSQFGFHFNNKNNVLVFKTDYHKYMGLKLDIPLEDPMYYTTYYNGYDFEANSTKIADYFANPGNYPEIVTYDASVNGFNGPLNDWTSGQNIRSVGDILFIVQGSHQETNVRDGRIVKFDVSSGNYIGQITTYQSEEYEYFQHFAVNSTHIAIRKSKTDTVEIHTHGGSGSPAYVKTITEQTGLANSSVDYYGYQPNMNENYLTFGSPGYVNTPTAPNPNSRGAVEVYDTVNFNLIGRLLPDPTKNHWIQGAIYGYNLSSTNIQAVTYAVNGSQPVEKIIYLYNLNGMMGDKTPTATISSTENNFGRFLEFAVVEDSTGTPRTLLIVPVGEDGDAIGQKIYIYDASNNGELLSVIDSQSSPDLFPDTIFDTSNPFKSQIIALHANPEGQNYVHADTNGIGRDFLMIMGTRWHHGMAKASLYMESKTKRKALVNGLMSDFESSDTALKSEKNNLLVKLLELESRLSAGGL